MDILIWMSVVSGFLALCRICKPIFHKLAMKYAYKILNQNRQNGKDHGKEKREGEEAEA
jgi:hypothetical protein